MYRIFTTGNQTETNGGNGCLLGGRRRPKRTRSPVHARVNRVGWVRSPVASPLRFRRSRERWSADRVDRDLRRPLDGKFGATISTPRFAPGDGYTVRRLDMDNGDFALFAWNDELAYWLGNTETPSVLWRTEKFAFDEVPYSLSRWAQRELLADLAESDPWLAKYDYLTWFFLPVLFSKDGRDTSRKFFREHAAGFPDADRDEALAFYDDFLKTGVLEDYRYVMASKLGTSQYLDPVRMGAAMGEFTTAKILSDAGYEVTPEIEVTTGHSLDFKAENADGGVLVEVTRPRPPSDRAADSPIRAIRETAETKTNGQLSEHGGGAVLFVDCSSYRDDDWAAIRAEKPDVRHRPAVVFRARPSGHIEGYRKGSVPLDLDGAVDWL